MKKKITFIAMIIVILLSIIILPSCNDIERNGKYEYKAKAQYVNGDRNVTTVSLDSAEYVLFEKGDTIGISASGLETRDVDSSNKAVILEKMSANE